MCAMNNANVIALCFDELTHEIFDANFVIGESFMGTDGKTERVDGTRIVPRQS